MAQTDYYPYWKISDLARMITATLLNKYDFFIVVEGFTGIGKSTFAYKLAKRVSMEFKKLYMLDREKIEYYYYRIARNLGMTPMEFIEKILALKDINAYDFNPYISLVYTQDEFQQHMASWNNIAISDEMINVTFNRDFYSQKQKDIIKMINMFRDHCNLTIACVPYFSTLDTQIKNLTKVKVTIKKRGLGIVHTPNPVIYSRDKWDTITNEKIEREWIMKKIRKPNYTKLTTFRGFITFKSLSKKEEEIYQKIKNSKRNLVLKEEMKVEEENKKKPSEDIKEIYDKLLRNEIKNEEVFEGLALSNKMTKEQLKRKIINQLKKEGLPYDLNFYFWENKTKIPKMDFGPI